MRPRTPGFNGQCLKEAREVRGLSSTDLANLIGKTRQAVSQYENGTITPDPDTFDRICSALNLPRTFFLGEATPDHPHPVFFRALTSATKRARTREHRRLGWAGRIVRYVEGFVEFPELRLPDLSPPANPEAISTEFIENAAEETRRFWGLGDGPISNAVWLFENNGVIVIRTNLASAVLDAHATWTDEVAPHRGAVSPRRRPIIFLNSEKMSAARSRFDLGHELGHILLHSNVKESDLRKPEYFRLIEMQAHRFAGAFHMPAQSFAADIPFYVDLDLLRVLKSKWRMSIGSMIMRCSDLDLVTPDDKQRLWAQYARRGWKKREPLDDELAIEEPRFLRRAIDLIISEGIRSKDGILHDLALGAGDVEELAGLPTGYFNAQAGRELFLRVKESLRSYGQRGSGDPKVIPFPGPKR